jgi:hypothetical protein
MQPCGNDEGRGRQGGGSRGNQAGYTSPTRRTDAALAQHPHRCCPSAAPPIAYLTPLHRHIAPPALAHHTPEPCPAQGTQLGAAAAPPPPTCEAAAALNALSTTSVTRCEVSTLPPTTAAVSEGLSKHPGGMRTVMAARQPWLRGMSRVTMHLRRRGGSGMQEEGQEQGGQGAVGIEAGVVVLLQRSSLPPKHTCTRWDISLVALPPSNMCFEPNKAALSPTPLTPHARPSAPPPLARAHTSGNMRPSPPPCCRRAAP